VETSSHCLWNCDQQEIRYDHHDFYWSEHADNDIGPLPSKSNVEFCTGQSQHGIHSDIQFRMYSQNICTETVLFQRTMEHL